MNSNSKSKQTKTPTYNAAAVQKEIAKDKRISKKEGKVIHALLKGRQSVTRTIEETSTLEKFCYVAVHADEGTARIGIVKYNETGYYATSWPDMPMEAARELVKAQNETLGLSEDVAESMYIASMVGWHAPIATRAHEYFKFLASSPAPIEGMVWEKKTLPEVIADMMPESSVTEPIAQQTKPSIAVDADLWQSISFLIQGLAIMEVFKREKPALHTEAVRLAQLIEKVGGAQ
jgi:hypothetical protein